MPLKGFAGCCIMNGADDIIVSAENKAIREATAARLQGGRVILKDLTMTPAEIRNIGRIIIIEMCIRDRLKSFKAPGGA